MATFEEQLNNLLERTHSIKSPINAAAIGTDINEYNRPSEVWINDVEIFYNNYLKEHPLGDRMKTILFHRNLDQILSRMKSLDFNSEAVQTVVEQLFCFLSECDTAKEIGEKYTPVFFSKFTAPFFLEGSDIGEINIATYGREGAEFIARAIAFFGGFDSLDDLYEL